MSQLNLTQLRTNITHKVSELAREVLDRRNGLLECFAAAYLLEMDIPASEAVLVEDSSFEPRDGRMKYTWHFERKDTYRVFFWPKVKSLSNYTRGVCLAVALSKEEAISKIYESIRATISPPNDFPDWVREELQATEPEIVEMPDWPYAYWQWGSE